MKQLSIYLCTALLLFGCGGSDTDPAETGLITYEDLDTETTTTDNAAGQTIVEYASNTPQLSTFEQAVKASNLDRVIGTGGPYTVFAPSNEAFEALPEGTLDDLLKPENQEQLLDILTYHVLAGNVTAADMSDGMQVNTMNEEALQVEREGDQVMVNEANVTTPDVEVSNGVVHVIDKVLMPPTAN